MIDGVAIPVTLGDVVFDAEMVDGVCDLPEVALRASVPPEAMDSDAYGIGLRTDDQCRLIVDLVGEVSTAEASGASAAAVEVDTGVFWPEVEESIGVGGTDIRPDDNCTNFNGWARNVVREQFGVDATSRKINIHYVECRHQDGSLPSFNAPNSAGGYCYHSYFPGWRPPECTSRTSDSTPAQIWRRGWGRYTWSCSVTPPCPPYPNSFSYTSFVEFNVGVFMSPPDWFNFGCTHTGTMPPAWDLRCYGRRDRVGEG